MAMRYHLMAVVIVTMIGALGTVPWGVNDELAARTSTDIESARPDTQRASVAQVAEVDPELPRYAPSEPLATGALQVVSGVATFHLAEQWAEALNTYHPALVVRARSIEAARTPPWWQLSTQPTVAVLSEPMTDIEVVAFERQWGYAPTRLPVALSAVAVIVHPSNPISKRGLAMPTLRAIFAQIQSPGDSTIRNWGDLGLIGIWRQRPITLYGHDASTGLFVDFRQRVLNGGLFKARVNRQPSSAAVVAAVSRDTGAIGYAGLSFVKPQVAVIPLAVAPQQLAIAPTPENLLNQRYPLRRVIYLYLNRPPDQALDAPHLALLRFIYSDQGQRTVAKRGYTPLPASIALQALRELSR